MTCRSNPTIQFPTRSTMQQSTREGSGEICCLGFRSMLGIKSQCVCGSWWFQAGRMDSPLSLVVVQRTGLHLELGSARCSAFWWWQWFQPLVELTAALDAPGLHPGGQPLPGQCCGQGRARVCSRRRPKLSRWRPPQRFRKRIRKRKPRGCLLEAAPVVEDLVGVQKVP